MLVASAYVRCVQLLQSVVRQMENMLQLPSVANEHQTEVRLKKITDALGDWEDPHLLEVVFHTALTLALFPSRITHLLKNICFRPSVVKVSREAEVHSSLHPMGRRGVASALVTLWLCRSLLFLLVPWAEKKL